MVPENRSRVHDLIERAARAIDALAAALRGAPVGNEVLPAADELVRELRTYLKGAR